MDDIGWGLDPWGLDSWGSDEDESGGGKDAVGYEPMDGVVLSPGVFVFEQTN
jgi:hypothetical protein